ncbi:ester cyclase [Bradyrhizobium sp. 2TAF24]|uniref:ester cyclase n=1 Tax=Bradyrhizobium sp. 2TAF24 TaxID=3233011 RepID=UPI003F922982
MQDTTSIRSRFLDFRERLYIRHDLGAVDEYVHPLFRSHSDNIAPVFAAYRASRPSDPEPLDMRPAYKLFVTAFHVGLPDLQPVHTDIVVEAQQLMAMTRWSGTHLGPFRGLAATGKTLHFATADLYQLRDGLLAEHWDIADALDAWTTLGLVQRI